MPQLKLRPRASHEAVLALLEPWILVAEFTPIASLLTVIREKMILASPPEVFGKLCKRVLESAGKADIPELNRETLYDIANDLEAAAKARRDEPPLLLPEGAEPDAKEGAAELDGPPACRAQSPPPDAARKQKCRKKRARQRASHLRKKVARREAREADVAVDATAAAEQVDGASVADVAVEATPARKAKRKRRKTVDGEEA
eukprot:NODE_13685_length_1152_cov_3.980488.p1 GENE.NODE_13685_length_1152_cov_3.980488~~NODE_13685_length_1152_cov_3.980488.p1  ORF type:complete len:202 (-),score=67.12 NODE_13685_length_1152_cov_3.980488:110-715(-)